MRTALAAFPVLTLAGAAQAQPAEPPSLDQLLGTYSAAAPDQPEADVLLDAWIERRSDGGGQMVVVIWPEGETRLNADPGITVTPAPGQRLSWQVAVPYRHVDPTTDYFKPNATVRMPFEGEVDAPVSVLVEFAYCVADFQCFFAEEELSVAELAE